MCHTQEVNGKEKGDTNKRGRRRERKKGENKKRRKEKNEEMNEVWRRARSKG